MKHFIIIGAKSSGKSETINAVCKALNPTKVWKVDFNNKRLKEWAEDIVNETYIIEVNGKNILVIAGSPTEQHRTITEIYQFIIETLNIEISFILSAKRVHEKLPGYNTIEELAKISTYVDKVDIERIQGTNEDNITSNPIFQSRVAKIVDTIKRNL